MTSVTIVNKNGIPNVVVIPGTLKGTQFVPITSQIVPIPHKMITVTVSIGFGDSLVAQQQTGPFSHITSNVVSNLVSGQCLALQSNGTTITLSNTSQCFITPVPPAKSPLGKCRVMYSTFSTVRSSGRHHGHHHGRHHGHRRHHH